MRYNGGICTILLYFTVCFFAPKQKTLPQTQYKSGTRVAVSRFAVFRFLFV